MSASRMPALSPMAAKPSARLHEVVDLPTPSLPEATAMTCLTPGMPAAFEVARALVSDWVADTALSLRSKGIVLLHVARPQIVLGRHDRRTLWPRMRVKTLVDDGFDAAICAHLDDIETFGVGALKHPMLVAEFCQHAVDRAFGAERLAARDAIEGLFFLQHAKRRVPCPKVEPGLERDDVLGTG